MCSSGGCPQTPDTNNTKGAKAKRSIGKAIMTIKDGNQRGPPPKKMINVNGIMKMNPEYTKWKAGASAPTESEVAHAETGMLIMDLSQVPTPGISFLTCQFPSSDATGIPMVAATFAMAEDSSAAYKAPTGAEPQATTTITTTTYTTPPPQQYPPQNAGHAPVYHNKSLGGYVNSVVIPCRYPLSHFSFSCFTASY
jgi:hypothetical protein